MFGEIKDRLFKIFNNRSSFFCVVCLIFGFFLVRQVLSDKGVGHSTIISLILVVIGCVIFFFWKKLSKKGVSLEKRFLVAAIPLGIMFLAVLPPGQTPDDMIHFARVYDIANGALITDTYTGEYEGAVGGDVPVETLLAGALPSSGTYGRIVDNLFENSGEMRQQTFTAAALYNPLCYIPQILATLIGKLFNAPLFIMLYLIEIVNFITWLLLFYFAIKFIPGKKICVLFVALFPITLQQATSISPDALTIALCVFLISYVFYLAYGKIQSIRKHDMIILAVMASLIGFCKIVYLPLIMLYLLIPYKRYGTKKKKWIFTISLFAFVGIVNLLWLIVSSRYLVEIRDGVNSSAQLSGIIGNPFSYLVILVRTISMNASFYLDGLYGSSLGAFAINLPVMIVYIYLIITVCLFIQNDDSVMKLPPAIKYYLMLILLVIAGLIFTSLYLQWTPYKGMTVEGIQGRYFIPILLLVPFVVASSSKKNQLLISNNSVVAYSLLVDVVAIASCFAANI